MKKNPIEELLSEQGFNGKEAEVFEEILKYARASQATPTKDSLKNFIKNKIDTLTDYED
jgi:hypothetical protein